MSPANPDDLIGRLIDGRYQVRSLIARGGMATVYVATDLRLERRVAIKIMHDHLAADEAFRARFIQEARAAAKLAHPNVVNVYDQGEDRGLAYIVMEYIPGITLRDLLHDHHRLTAEQTIDVMDAVLSGLQAAHRVGIVHRDLKPENVLLADDGRIKLSDFGLARAASANTASGSVLLGTIAYLSPELVTKGTADIRSDIYSLGIMMYEMLTGEQPYRGDQPVNIAFRHANEDVPPPSRIRPGVPGQLDDLVVWATERDPEARPADAGAMLVALRQAEQEIAAGGGAVSAPLDPRMSVAPTGVERDQIVVSAGDGPEVGYAMPDERPTNPFGEPAIDAFDDADEPDYDLGREPAPATRPMSYPEPSGAGAAAAGGPVVAAPAREMAPVGAVEPAPRRRRRLWPVLLSVLGVLLLVGGIGGWWALAGPGSYQAVPDVVGQDRAAAQQTLEGAGFALGEVTEEHSLEAPEGQVLASDPGAGTTLAPDSPVNLTVSAGPETLTVPALAGLSRDQAIETIGTARFAYEDGTDVSEFSEQPEGNVIRATDAAGGPLPAEMPEQSPIRLVISLGEVPNVVGQTVDQATANLAEVGLQLSVSGEEFSSTVPKGQIISYSLSADPMKPGDSVNVSVSKGQDLVAVPNVVGQSTRQAIATLEAAGFKVTHNVPQNFLDSTKVTGQNPAAGSQQPRGTTITIQSSLQF